jgi:hypothetical protein
MKILPLKNLLYITLILCIYNTNSFAQTETVTLEQDPKFEQLLNDKIKLNPSIFVNEKYKIQIYNGDSEASKKALSDFRRDYKNFDATIIFNTPSYKVWVGNFKTRIDAEKNLMEIIKDYPKAFLVKPNK